MTFKEFLDAYRADTLNEDAAWRAYDIEAVAMPHHAERALKLLGLGYAGELALPEAMARYGIQDPQEAVKTLARWWIWQRVNGGRRAARVRLRSASVTLDEGTPPGS